MTEQQHTHATIPRPRDASAGRLRKALVRLVRSLTRAVAIERPQRIAIDRLERLPASTLRDIGIRSDEVPQVVEAALAANEQHGTSNHAHAHRPVVKQVLEMKHTARRLPRVPDTATR